jgi:hypothetical protein
MGYGMSVSFYLGRVALRVARAGFALARGDSIRMAIIEGKEITGSVPAWVGIEATGRCFGVGGESEERQYFLAGSGWSLLLRLPL